MIVQSLEIEASEFETATGWALKPEGACKGQVCIPLTEDLTPGGDARLDLRALAAALGLPLVHDEEHRLWAVGPESMGARALSSAEAPELVLPDLDGNLFRLSGLRGQRVVVYAWAPY